MIVYNNSLLSMRINNNIIIIIIILVVVIVVVVVFILYLQVFKIGKNRNSIYKSSQRTYIFDLYKK